MKGIMRRPRGRPGAHGIGGHLAVLVLVVMACPGADAAPIHHRGADLLAMEETVAAHPVKLRASDIPVFKEWSTFLHRGPALWAEADDPPLTPAVWSAIWHSVRTDPGGASPMVDFLLWKQSIDPPRFAHYHPTLAPVLHRDRLARSSPHLVSHEVAAATNPGGPTTPSSTPSTQPTTSPGNLNPPTVPEPGMLLIAAGLTAWAVRKLRGRDGREGA
jgi:hypothetical protein